MKCHKCNLEITKTPENICGNYVLCMCNDGIGNQTIIAAKYGAGYKPISFFLEAYAYIISRIVKIEDKRTKVIVDLLNEDAIAEEIAFNRIKWEPDVNGYLLIIRGKPSGYLVYNTKDTKEPCLRQIYIIEKERRKGYALSLLDTFFFSSTLGLRFNYCIESPEPEMMRLLCSIGDVELKGNKYIPKKYLKLLTQVETWVIQ